MMGQQESHMKPAAKLAEDVRPSIATAAAVTDHVSTDVPKKGLKSITVDGILLDCSSGYHIPVFTHNFLPKYSWRRVRNLQRVDLSNCGMYIIHISFLHHLKGRLIMLNLENNRLPGGKMTNASAKQKSSVEELLSTLVEHDCFYTGNVIPADPRVQQRKKERQLKNEVRQRAARRHWQDSQETREGVALEPGQASSLPAGILSLIFGHLHYSDLVHILRVCKHWNRSLMRFPPPAWSTLNCDGSTMDLSKFNVDSFLLAASSERFKRLSSVKLTSLSRIGKKTFDQLGDLYPQLPTLKVVALKNFDHLCMDALAPLKNLQVLHLERLRRGADRLFDFKPVFSALVSLKELSIRMCGGIFNSVELLDTVFCGHNTILPHLKTLDLSDNLRFGMSPKKKRVPWREPVTKLRVTADKLKPKLSLETLCVSANVGELPSVYHILSAAVPALKFLYLSTPGFLILDADPFQCLASLKYVAIADESLNLEYYTEEVMDPSGELSSKKTLRKDQVRVLYVNTPALRYQFDSHEFIRCCEEGTYLRK